MCQASILPTELQLPPFQHRFQCASPRTQSRQAVGQSQGHPQAHFLVHIAQAQSVNGMPSRCALVPGTREGGFVPSKFNNKYSFLTSAGLYWSPAPSWRAGTSGVPDRKTIISNSTALWGTGPRKLGKVPPRDSRNSRKPETRAAEGRRWAGGAEYRWEMDGEKRAPRAFLATPDLPKWREKPCTENDSLWGS